MDYNNQGVANPDKRILIVEDELDYLDMLTERLQEEGFIISRATNGQQAIDMMKIMDVDLILLDMLMPQMDGVTFFYHLHNTLKKNPPVIILTNFTETAYPQGVADFLIKSNTSMDDVVKKIRNILPKSK
ncbi:MAG: response regulator [Candidatus Roizmanbacteria bacterium]|nr:response regulator [Candidatus Roizmanbacteria bacterium]